jgi:uncharacterized membrane protein YdbT with pleckstrin-like domain
MLPAGEGDSKQRKNNVLPIANRSAAADTMNAEPPDAQQEQGTTTEKDARAEALRRSVLPLLLFSAAG